MNVFPTTTKLSRQRTVGSKPENFQTQGPPAQHAPNRRDRAAFLEGFSQAPDPSAAVTPLSFGGAATLTLMKTVIALLVFLIFCTNHAAAVDPKDYYDAALKCLDENKEAKAADFLKVAATLGHDKSQFLLGFMLQQGRGIERDDKEAATMFEKAASQGNKDAKAALEVIIQNRRNALAEELRAKPKTYVPIRNEVRWFRQEGAGKPSPLKMNVVLDKDAKSSLRVGNGNDQPSLGKLINEFTNQKVCEFVVLPRSELTLEHVPDGRYRLIFALGDEIIYNANTFWKPSLVSKFRDAFDFKTTVTTYTRVTEWTDQSITFHKVKGGSAKTDSMDEKEFANY